jgi:hypothetical protein
MIHAGNLNNPCIDPVAVLEATRMVNHGQILSPLEPRRGQILSCRPEPSKICPIFIL